MFRLSEARREAATVRQLTAALGATDARANAVGLGLGLVLTAALGALVVALSQSGGPPVRVQGVVVGYGMRETYLGSEPVLRVRVDGGEVSVPVSRDARCAVGDPIPLDRRRALLGYRYAATVTECAAALPPPRRDGLLTPTHAGKRP